MQESNLGEDLVRALVGLPKYVIQYVGGLIVGVLTDFFLTGLAISSVLAALLLSSVLVGFATFFLIYTVLKPFIYLNDAVGFGLQGLARAAERNAPVYMPERTMPLTPLDEPSAP